MLRRAFFNPRSRLFILVIAAVFGFAAIRNSTTQAQTSGLKVQYLNADSSPSDNQIKPHFNIINQTSSTINLSTLKIRYYFTKDGGASTFSTFCDFAAVGCSNVTNTVFALSPAQTGADSYLEVGFTGGSIAAGGQSGDIQSRFNKTDFSNFNETDDYSYGTNTTYADSTKITLYQNGTLIWGTAPGNSTGPTNTATFVPPTSTSAATVAPTKTATKTNTPSTAPTATRTNTSVPATTAAPTNGPTKTNTPRPTVTSTPVAATSTPVSTTANHTPILFVHGWSGSASNWNTMVSRFEADGWPANTLFTWTYDSSQSNAVIASQVQSQVNMILQQTGASKVDIISHSMGGLSSRYYLKNLGGTSVVDAWVSLGGPNHGTTTASSCSSSQVSCAEMLPNSTFLNALNATDETPGNVRYATWWSNCDGVINPPTSVILTGATNTQTACIDHMSLLTDATVYAQVRDWVK